MKSTIVTCKQGTQNPDEASYTHFIVMLYGWHQKTMGQDRWAAEVMTVLRVLAGHAWAFVH